MAEWAQVGVAMALANILSDLDGWKSAIGELIEDAGFMIAYSMLVLAVAIAVMLWPVALYNAITES